MSCLTLLTGLLVFVTYFSQCHSGHVITTPRRWTSGANAQVCLFLKPDNNKSNVTAVVVDDNTTNINIINVALNDDASGDILVPEKSIILKDGMNEICDRLFVPSTVQQKSAKLTVNGTLYGKPIHYSKDIDITTSVGQTYIQTDKYLYKQSQKVQFRILTIQGPFLKISLDAYKEVWVENPTGTRIAQWSDVVNKDGLVHQDFKLSDEPEEGTYHIKVRDYKGDVTKVKFKVEEYVLPRFEVSIKPPAYILGIDSNVTFTVCAKYTFGQPVKGKVSLTVDNDAWGRYKQTAREERNITGCQDITITNVTLPITSADYNVYNLEASAIVVENGTNVELFADVIKVEISRTALSFENVGHEEYYKPELPFIGKFKVTWPDKSTAVNEPIKICADESCKTIDTDHKGVVSFVIPPHIRKSIRLNAVNYDSVKGEHAWRHTMYTSSSNLQIKEYYSPSNSSLIITPRNDKLKCRIGKSINVDLPVVFASTNQSKAAITVQVISRGQIQYMDTKDYPLISGPLTVHDDYQSLEPIVQPASPHTIYGTLEIQIVLPRTVSPTAKVLVWYSRDDEEVVSDVREIDVTKCLDNDVKLTWSDSIVEPGDKSSLKINAEPNSLCSLGVVDKSVDLLSAKKNQLTIHQVFKIVSDSEVKKYDNVQVNNDVYCRSKKPEIDPAGPPSPAPPILPLPIRPPLPLPPIALIKPISERPLAVPEVLSPSTVDTPVPELIEDTPIPIEMLPSDSDGDVPVRSIRSSPPRRRHEHYTDSIDSLQMFDEAGLYILSDLTVETRPCKTRETDYNYYVAYDDYDGGMDFMIEEMVYNSPPRSQPAPAALPPPPPPHPLLNPISESTKQTPRSYFPETWLWEMHLVLESGELLQNLTLPDTVTEWVGQAVCVHPTKGLGLSSRSSITTFTPFFIDLTLPATVKRGEIFPVKISVFNYMDDSMPVKIILEESVEYDILGETGEELYLPQSEGGVRSTCINAQDKSVLTVRIRPKVVGDVNLTVSATVDKLHPDACLTKINVTKSDLIIKPIKVELEGFPKEQTWTKFICSDEIDSNLDFLEDWKIDVPPVIVDDSARGWVSVVSDLLGPSLENLGNLVKLPTGCGEQNMLNFAPNIFVLQYLDASNQTTQSIAGKAIDFMKTGYQRELNYRHPDGSFSAFGSSDSSGSTWLTAFVVKSFAQARQFISIDKDDLEMSITWLRKLQKENGCFDSVGKVLHKGMKGGVADAGSPATLSAYILISLLEAGESGLSKAVENSIYCLNSDNNTHPYTVALKAYALALTGLPAAEKAVQDLLSIATVATTGTHWELPNGSGKSNGVGVETAGYAVLALTTLDSKRFVSETKSIVMWMSTQRNGQGGFVSTQDTVVALQALASYEKSLQQGPVDLVLEIESLDNLHTTLYINDKNKLLQQTVNLPTVPTTVFVNLHGQGCTLVQAVLRYNVPEGDLGTAFKLNVESSTAIDKGCKTKNIKVCASYLLSDEISNMAVIEVNLISGYIPKKDDLKRLVNQNKLIKRYEIDGGAVNIYIEEFSSKELCIDFDILREVEVENPKPATVRIYDYYEPELYVNEKYTLPPVEECKYSGGGIRPMPVPLPARVRPKVNAPIFVRNADEVNVVPQDDPATILNLRPVYVPEYEDELP